MEKDRNITFGEGFVFERLASQVTSVLITDKRVYSLYEEELQGSGLDVLTIPAGEFSKSRETIYELENVLLDRGYRSDLQLIGMGGGVICDIVGFLASTYCRSVPHILIPTSLLAMVDASIGGKTGVNTSHGKNLIGSIYPPVEIWTDIAFLSSLPAEEIAHGYAEMFKASLLASPTLLVDLERGRGTALEAIQTSASIKCDIVERDPSGTRERHLLNLGHTVGHALEQLEEYRLPHGQAVGVGLLVECYISYLHGYLPHKEWEKILSAAKKIALKTSLPRPIPFAKMMKAMSGDKKAIQKTPRFVQIQRIGIPETFSGEYCAPATASVLEEAIEWMNRQLVKETASC